VLAHDRSVRIYSTGTQLAETVVACSLLSGSRITLLPAYSPGFHGLHHSVGGFELAGAIVGFTEAQFGVDSGTTRLVIADVARGRVLRSIAGGNYVDAGFVLAEGISRFVMTPTGAVAWVATRSKAGQLTGVTVSAAARAGAPAVLDEGLGIDPSSLRLAGGTVSWSDGGVLRTAPVP
jgi:hypothetical protein